MNNQRINILVASIFRDLAEDFLETGMADDQGDLAFEDVTVHFDIIAGDPAQEPDFDSLATKANAVALVVRFLDVLSLDKIRAIYKHFPDTQDFPISMVILRDKDEMDFKISCPSCGQKLWLRDTDVGKRGRCPNCTKPFVIPSQEEHLKVQLHLPDNVAINKVVRKNQESFINAIASLLSSKSDLKAHDKSTGQEAAKNATMRIQIQDV
jgi:predicted RNA-binding Zn-ribbon protein involved in translation (DUF1610 family)